MHLIRTLLAAPAALLIALPTRAEPAHDALTLTYIPSRAAAPFCPSADFLTLEVNIRLSYDLFQPSAPNHLTFKVGRSPAGVFHSTGEIRDDDGNVTYRREFSDIDCTSAFVSMAIYLAVKFMEPPEAPEPVSPAPLPPASNPPVLPPASSPPALKPAALAPPTTPALPAAERPRLQTGIASVFTIGAAPTVVGGVSGLVGVRWGAYSLELEGSALFAPSATIGSLRVSAGYHYLVAAAAGSGCLHGRRLFGCARTEASVLAVGHPEATITGERTASFGIGLRFGAEWELTPGVVLRAYGDFLLRPISGLTRENKSKRLLWPGSGASFSLGLGPVISFSAL